MNDFSIELNRELVQNSVNENKLYAKRLPFIPSLAVELHLKHGIFQRIYFNLETPLGLAEQFIIEANSFTCSIFQTI